MNSNLITFLDRIRQLTPNTKAKYGQMNVHQMVCHCTDFYRFVLGLLKLEEQPTISAMEALQRAQSRETVPAPRSIDQVKGNGTPPTTFEEDRKALETHLKAFYQLDEYYDFPEHFYFGILNRSEWHKASDYHLSHHLRQFGV